MPGSDLPDSIKVGRTAPVISGLELRVLERFDVLVCSERGSLRTGLGVDGTGVPGAGGVSESDWPDLRAGDGLGLFNRSAASAPAFRICSSVGCAGSERLRVLGFVRCGSGGTDSEGASSTGGAVGLGTSGFLSRATMTSCEYKGGASAKLQSRIMPSRFGISSGDKKLRSVRKPPFTRSFGLIRLAVRP